MVPNCKDNCGALCPTELELNVAIAETYELEGFHLLPSFLLTSYSL